MFNATYLLRLPGFVTLDEREEIIDKIQEDGAATVSGDGRGIKCEWVVTSSQWRLRGLVEETIHTIEANFPGVKFSERDEPEWTLTETES